ncbi:MAG: thymidine kinase [Phycisphaerae bacterium]|nr:thymidine kinase [Phycisphaerae bacterium]MCZ2401268.1 thymidine kinase [Phycisphaerae bacterium]
MTRTGRIEVICGCMFSGKTSLLIERLRAAQAAGRSVRAFKHVLDGRYDPAALATHDARRFPAESVADADALAAAAHDCGVVGIDEAHFFGGALVERVRRLAGRGATVIVAGIDHDAWGQAFPMMDELKRLADDVCVRTVPCGACGAPARLSQRMTPLTPEDDMVGGPGAYEPRCAACFRPLPPPAPAY